METSGTPPVRAGYVQNADGSWSPLTGSGAGTTSSDGALTTSGTPAPIGIMSQDADGTWSGWNGGSGTTAPPQVYPPAGLAVSTGTAWGTSLDAANPRFQGSVNAAGTQGPINSGVTIDFLDGTGGRLISTAAVGSTAALDFLFISLSGDGTSYNEFLRYRVAGNLVEAEANLQVDGNLHVVGTITSDTLTQLEARIAALEAKVG